MELRLRFTYLWITITPSKFLPYDWTNKKPHSLILLGSRTLKEEIGQYHYWDLDKLVDWKDGEGSHISENDSGRNSLNIHENGCTGADSEIKTNFEKRAMTLDVASGCD